MLYEFDSTSKAHAVFRGYDVGSLKILNTVGGTGSALVLSSLGMQWHEVTHHTLLQGTESVSSYSRSDVPPSPMVFLSL